MINTIQPGTSQRVDSKNRKRFNFSLLYKKPFHKFVCYTFQVCVNSVALCLSQIDARAFLMVHQNKCARYLGSPLCWRFYYTVIILLPYYRILECLARRSIFNYCYDYVLFSLCDFSIKCLCYLCCMRGIDVIMRWIDIFLR